ncbi:MAG TPA: MATE family efflux transporter [Micropepsaceae bacterium]|nr:MATE family efflux transporter [Micropepsaceae bacterium]
MTATHEPAAEGIPPAHGSVFAAYRREAKAMLRLSAPIMATQMLWMAVGIADVIMIGTLGAVPLAAVALGSALFYFFFVPAMGFLQAVSPIAAQAIGADGNGLNRELRKAATTDDLRDTCRSGLWVAVLGALPIIVIVLFSETILLSLG